MVIMGVEVALCVYVILTNGIYVVHLDFFDLFVVNVWLNDFGI
jgi:hypothetical protein